MAHTRIVFRGTEGNSGDFGSVFAWGFRWYSFALYHGFSQVLHSQRRGAGGCLGETHHCDRPAPPHRSLDCAARERRARELTKTGHGRRLPVIKAAATGRNRRAHRPRCARERPVSLRVGCAGLAKAMRAVHAARAFTHRRQHHGHCATLHAEQRSRRHHQPEFVQLYEPCMMTSSIFKIILTTCAEDGGVKTTGRQENR